MTGGWKPVLAGKYYLWANKLCSIVNILQVEEVEKKVEKDVESLIEPIIKQTKRISNEPDA